MRRDGPGTYLPSSHSFLTAHLFSKCDRCATGFAEPRECVYDALDVTCARCLNNTQGCYWGGTSLEGKAKQGRTGKSRGASLILPD